MDTTAPMTSRYHMDQGFPRGRFERSRPGYRYNIVRIDHDHHTLLAVAACDWPSVRTGADDYAIYEHPDHIAWYLLYNAQSGAYVHVTNLGA